MTAPYKLSPVHRQVAKLAASDQVRDVALCDLSHYAKVQIGLKLFCAPRAEDLAQFAADPAAVDRTAGLACFLLLGPKGVEVLNRLCSLDLRETAFPDGSLTRAPLARVNTWIRRRDRSALRAYEISVSREYGEYVWGAIWEAGRSFGITVYVETVVSTTPKL